MGRIIKIPLKAHVKQFYIARYGDTPKANLNNIIGCTLYGTCSHVRMNRRTFHEMLDRSLLSVELTTNHLKHKFWDKDRTMRAARVLEKHFNDVLINFCDGYQFNPDSSNVHAAISNFCGIYAITEDHVSLDTLRKVYRDHQNRMTKK